MGIAGGVRLQLEAASGAPPPSFGATVLQPRDPQVPCLRLATLALPQEERVLRRQVDCSGLQDGLG